ncbi:uncharacterized protein [Palaemon carinicauda]|uniref:uncharacterized protein n=1 Tax=Palaemon carinicauda TaxID=392227 RepID=UPI0035B698B1
MVKFVVASILLIASLASANPAGSTSDKDCTGEDYTCICRNLVTVKDKAGLIEFAQECTSRLGINCKVLPGTFWNLPDNAKNCALEKMEKAENLIDDNGVANVAQMTQYLREVINAERSSDVTDTQVDAIVGDVQRCSSEGTGSEKALFLYTCLLDSCKAALSQ